MVVASKMDCRDEATSRALEITLETPSVRSWSNAPDAFSLVWSSAIINLLMNGWDYIVFKTIRQRVILCHVPSPLSEGQWSQFNRVIGRPTLRHVTSRSWSSITIDQRLQIARRRVVTDVLIINWKFDFKLEKSIFNSGKSLKIKKNSEKIQKNP